MYSMRMRSSGDVLDIVQARNDRRVCVLLA